MALDSPDAPVEPSLPGASGSIMRVGRAVRLYLAARRAELAGATRREHAYNLEHFYLWLGEDMALRAVRPKHLQQYLSAHPQWAPSTARVRLSTIRTFFSWCVDNRHLSHSPAALVKGPQQPRAAPRELTLEEAVKVMGAAKDNRTALILSLMFHEGLRRVEVARLQIGDVTPDTVTVHGKGGHERILPLSGTSRAAFILYMNEHPAASGQLLRSYLTGKGISVRHVGDLALEAFKDAGIKERPFDGRSAHSARHTAAGQMLDQGGDIRTVAAFLGHAKVSTTARYLARRQTVDDIRPFLPQYGGGGGNGESSALRPMRDDSRRS